MNAISIPVSHTSRTLAILLALILVACSESNTPNAVEPTPDGAGINAGTLNKSNYSAVLTQVFEVYSGRAYDKRLTTRPYFRVDGFQCDNEGEYLVTELQDDELAAVIKQCQIGGDTVNGGIITEFDDDSVIVNYDTLTSTFDPSGTINVNGQYETRCCESGQESFKTKDTNYSIAYDGGSLAVTTVATEQTLNWPVSGLLRGSFAMQPLVVNGANLNVSTAADLQYAFADLSPADAALYRDTWSYTSGRILIVADDGSSLELNATTGDPSSVFIIINNGTSTETIEDQWSQWLPAINWKPGLRFNNKPVVHGVTESLITAAGSEVDQLAIEVVHTAELVRNQAITSVEQAVIDEVIVYSTADMRRVITTGTLYQCPQGGEMLQQRAEHDNGEVATNFNVVTDRYEFRQCQIDTSFIEQADSAFTLAGTLEITNSKKLDSGFDRINKNRRWNGFTISGVDQWLVTLNGYFDHGLSNAAMGRNQSNFSSYTFNYVDALGVSQAITVSDYYHHSGSDASSGTKTLELSVDASITGPATAGQTVTLNSVASPLSSASESSAQTSTVSGELTASLHAAIN